MNKINLFFGGLILTLAGFAQKANYDESMVGNYVLPEMFVTSNGQEVTTKKIWETVRRPEILAMLGNIEYGNIPQTHIKTTWQILEESNNALGGKAIRRQVEFTFQGNGTSRKMLVLIYMPKNIKKCPVFVSPNFQGNQSTTEDEAVIASQYSTYPRGHQKSRWSYERIISSGYAVATFHYYDTYYDAQGHTTESVLPLWGINNDNELQASSGKAICAWAWGCSRVLDYLLTLKNIDKKRCIILGHSRLGKTALWAGALDKRFNMVISNNSGCSGAALSRRNYGETVARITKTFPWWFCNTYSTYADNPDKLPFDQHELLAMIAPRLLYVASAKEDRWADPRGEFLSLKEASKVYKLYGKNSLEGYSFPKENEPVWQDCVGYHIRTGIHDVTDFDWAAYIRFADEKLH